MAAVPHFLASNHPIIPLEQVVPYSAYLRQKFEYTHTDNTGTNPREVLRKYSIPTVEDNEDSERLLRVLHEFLNACNDDHLHIHDQHRYTYFRDVLGGPLQANWDDITQARQAADRDDANFLIDSRTFLASYLPSTAHQIQKEYLLQLQKPYSMNCIVLADRLRWMNILSVHLPGSGGNKLFPTDLDFKNAFFRLMPHSWQAKFAATDSQLDDVNYPFQRLLAFMDAQQRFPAHSPKYRQSRQNPFQANRQRRSQNNRFNYNRNPRYNGNSSRPPFAPYARPPPPNLPPPPASPFPNPPNLPRPNGGGTFSSHPSSQYQQRPPPRNFPPRGPPPSGQPHRSPYSLRSRSHHNQRPNNNNNNNNHSAYVDHNSHASYFSNHPTPRTSNRSNTNHSDTYFLDPHSSAPNYSFENPDPQDVPSIDHHRSYNSYLDQY